MKENQGHSCLLMVWLQGSFGLWFLFSGACHGPMFGGKADLGMVWNFGVRVGG